MSFVKSKKESHNSSIYVSPGSCLIGSDYEMQMQASKKAAVINHLGIDWCVNKVLEACIDFSNKTCLEPVVACMGLASMPDGSNLRDSFAKHITAQIIARSRAEVLVVEPNVLSHKSFRLTSCQDAYDKADIIVWLVKHRQFLSVKERKSKVEIDFCGINAGGYYGFPL